MIGHLLISSVWLAIVTWLILRAVGQRGLMPTLAPASLAEDQAQRVTVILPARDEAGNIGRCLRSLLTQDYPADRFNIITIDDHSTDDTAAIVREFAAADRRVSLLSAPPLPPRWTGKSHACWIGVQGRAADGEWLCFIDADVWGERALLSSAMHAARERDLDLLSLAPRQELKSFAERLMLPCGLILISFIQDLREVQSRSGSGVTATGQFMLIRRDVYEAAGGHAAVGGAICEDLELARRVKQSGHDVLMMSGEALLATRMYTGWRTLWPGLTKNLVDTVGGARAVLTVMPAALVLAWAAVLLPIVDAVGCAAGGAGAGAWAALIMALVASAAAFGMHIAATAYFRIPTYYGLLFPLGYTVGAVMAVDSVRRRLTGRVSWKGRIYS